MPPGSQYDSIGSTYAAVKELPATRFGEVPTVLALLGDLNGRRVLDVGCGTGHYSRICRALGASQVDGVDDSTEMISQARHLEEGEATPITYHRHDASRLPTINAYDDILAIYLFNYAADRPALRSMLGGLYRNCRIGARLVAFLAHGEPSTFRPELTKYGIGFTAPAASSSEATGLDAVELLVTAHCEPEVSFRSYALPGSVIDDCLRAEGFTETRWGRCSVSRDGIDRFGESFWNDFQVAPPWLTVTAVAG